MATPRPGLVAKQRNDVLRGSPSTTRCNPRIAETGHNRAVVARQASGEMAAARQARSPARLASAGREQHS